MVDASISMATGPRGLLLLALSCHAPAVRAAGGRYERVLVAAAQRAGCSPESCSGQPVSCPAGTPGIGTARPVEARHALNHTLAVLNAAAVPVRLSWLSSNGSGTHVADISPGRTRTVGARPTHS